MMMTSERQISQTETPKIAINPRHIEFRHRVETHLVPIKSSNALRAARLFGRVALKYQIGLIPSIIKSFKSKTYTKQYNYRFIY